MENRAGIPWGWACAPPVGVLLVGLYVSVMAPVLSVEQSARGVDASSARDHGTAVAEFNRALSLDSSNVLALKGRGWARVGAGVAYREAVEDFSRALSLAPEDPEAYAGRGMARLARGLHPLAEQDFREALRKPGNAVRANLGLALVAARTAQVDRALENLKAVLEAAELDQALLERGILRGMTGDGAGAQTDLDLVIRKAGLQLELNEKSAWSFLIRGRARSYRGLFTGDSSAYPQAAEDLDRAVQLNPDGDAGHLARGELSYFQGRYDQAVAACGEAIRRNPAGDEARALRAAAHAMAGNGTEAERDAQAALDVNPRSLWALLARGKAGLDRSGGTTGVREDLRGCLDLAPSHWPYRSQVEAWLRR